MDDELLAGQVNPEPARNRRCGRKGPHDQRARLSSAISDEAFEMGALSLGKAVVLPLGLPRGRIG